MIPKELTRWINASINTYFDSKRGAIPLWVEGLDLDPIRNQEKYVELRITGPHYKELPGMLEIELEINIMCSVIMKGNTHDIHNVVGIFQNAMSTVIDVKKYGNTPTVDDSSVLIGCLKLRNDVERSVDVVPWGMVDPATRLQQTSIDAFYSMQI